MRIGRKRRLKVSCSEGATRSGFEVAFEGDGLFARAEGDGSFERPRAMGCGRCDLAVVVFSEARFEV